MKDRRSDRTLGWRMHPIWRGIGFLLLVIVPVIAFFLSGMLLDYLAAEERSSFNTLVQSVGSDNILYLQLGVTFVLSVLIYLVYSVFGSLLYSLLGGQENEEIVTRIGSHRRRY